MKFGRKISDDLYSEWRPFYLDYNLLKRELKTRTVEREWTTDDEREFMRMLEKELDKIHDFQKAKTSELSRRIHDAAKDVKKLVAESSELRRDDTSTAPASPVIPQEAQPRHAQTPYAGQQLRHKCHRHDQHRQREGHRQHSTLPFDTTSSGQEPQGNGGDMEQGTSNVPHHEYDGGSDDDDVDSEGSLSDSDESGSEHVVAGETDTDESFDMLEERFHILEEEVANLVADVHDLALYTKLNITGFMKILKKHDKQTHSPLKSTFIQDFLEQRPFYKYNWDALIVKLSKLYDLIRTRGHPVQGDSSAGAGQSAFVRQTTKYWVHPDNLVPLKLAILRNLPVLVFDPNKEYEAKDSAITSIYFDNEDLELYLGRLEKTEGAEAIRLRWYGDTDVKTIFVERKTHREDWTGEKSVKARFPIKEHLVNAFLKGEYTVDAEFQQLVKRGKKTQQEVDSMIQLANEIQYAVLTRDLKPVMRTFYNRTAFQLPGDARVRISLDEQLTMIREDNWDGRIRSGDNWRRSDIGIDWPFEQLPQDDMELFKYGVLEVKLQTQFGQEPPKWVTDLVQSHLVEAVPKFSKFIHGCATLLPHRVDLVPFWLPQMDTDILKPNTGYLTIIERPAHTASSTSKGTSSRTSTLETPLYTEPLSEGEEDEELAIAPAKDEDKRTGLTGHEVAEAIAYREKMLQERRESETGDQKMKIKAVNGGIAVEEDIEEEEGKLVDERMPFLRQRRGSATIGNGKPRAMSIDPLAPSSAFDQTLRDRLKGAKPRDSYRELHTADEDEEEGWTQRSDARELVRDWRAPVGKRVAVPVRVEPKVYFAAERTFLKWINIAVLIGTIATTLLNFVPPEDSRGLISAAVFTFTALLAIAYAGIVFVYRAVRIRQRRADGLYHDKYGPTILCLVLLAAMATNIGLRMSEM